MPQGKGSQLHNKREYEKIGREIPENIDPSKSTENITLVDLDIRSAYREIFGDALDRYNSKQKRADRKIEDYYEHIQKSKNGEKLFYEDVVQWGSKDDFQTPSTREKAKEALVQYVQGFESRNPNLKIIGAYIHMDEASPHLHLDYIPVAHGYTRGLETRNSLDKAMKQMGYQPEKESRKNNATKLWKENERIVFGQICREHGLEVEAERKARGSLSVEEYKAARDEMLGEVREEVEDRIARAETAEEAVRAAEERKQELETQIAAMQQAQDAAVQAANAAAQTASREARKTLTGQIKLSQDSYDALMAATAAQDALVASERARSHSLEQSLVAVQEELRRANTKSFDELFEEISVEQLRLENQRLKKENTQLRHALSKITNFVKAKAPAWMKEFWEMARSVIPAAEHKWQRER